MTKTHARSHRRKARARRSVSRVDTCHSQLWTPPEPVSLHWPSLCANGLELALSYLRLHQPDSLRSLDQMYVFAPQDQALLASAFSDRHFTIDQTTHAPLVVYLRLSQVDRPDSSPVPSHVHTSRPASLPSALLDPLTLREQDVLSALAAGLSDQEMAQSLVIAKSTVKWHLKRIYSKLGANSRTQALAHARACHIIP